MMTDNWMWGTGYGLTHWIIFVVMVAVVLYPIGRILRRLGLSPFWSLLVFEQWRAHYLGDGRLV